MTGPREEKLSAASFFVQFIYAYCAKRNKAQIDDAPKREKPQLKYAYKSAGPNRKERRALYRDGIFTYAEATRAYNKPYRKVRT